MRNFAANVMGLTPEMSERAVEPVMVGYRQMALKIKAWRLYWVQSAPPAEADGSNAHGRL